MSKYRVTALIEEQGGKQRTIDLVGRDAWAFMELHKAGYGGCTPIDNPAPRWSAYVHKLRVKASLDIETVTEKHGGTFSGDHARYVMHTKVIDVQEVA